MPTINVAMPAPEVGDGLPQPRLRAARARNQAATRRGRAITANLPPATPPVTPAKAAAVGWAAWKALDHAAWDLKPDLYNQLVPLAHRALALIHAVGVTNEKEAAVAHDLDIALRNRPAADPVDEFIQYLERTPATQITPERYNQLLSRVR